MFPWTMLAKMVATLDLSHTATLGRALGWLVGSVLRIRRHIVESSMKEAGIEPTPSLVNRVYAQLGTNVFELLWAAGRKPSVCCSLVKVVGWDLVERAMAKGKGVVVATAHTGNWDLVGCAIAQRVSLAVVSKHLSWKSLDRFWQSIRAERGIDVIEASGALRQARKRLAVGGSVVFLVDQAPLRKTSVFQLPFLGRIAAHDAAFAIVAARNRVPVVVALPVRCEDGSLAVQVEAVLEPWTNAGNSAKVWVQSTVQFVSNVVESGIRKKPDQWLWLHRRWRR